MSTKNPITAHANPTKAFFVNMITRDITFDDSIMDLIDNSVDSAWSHAGNQPIGLNDGPDLSGYEISVTATPAKFAIVDNCGGMTMDDAVQYAFTFGRRRPHPNNDYGIGIYGIGMKRAVFKLGTSIRVRSTYQDATGTPTAFVVPITVADWLEVDTLPWDFAIHDATPLAENGVEIVVERLTPGAVSSFRNPAFIQNLRRAIARDYWLYLNRGLNIAVNGDAVRAAELALRVSDSYQPLRQAYNDQFDGEQICVEIISGMAAGPPDDLLPEEDKEGDKAFGWYVACNGRIVLAADKTAVSGWGTSDWPQWHSQYSGFIGLVLFTAAHVVSLPLTTTKRSIETSAPVFLRARNKMRDVSKKWIAYTNSRRHALETAKLAERAAVAVPIPNLTKHDDLRFPRFTRQPVEPIANVNYSVPTRRMTKLKRGFGRPAMSYRQVGLRSFDYAYDDLVGEE